MHKHQQDLFILMASTYVMRMETTGEPRKAPVEDLLAAGFSGKQVDKFIQLAFQNIPDRHPDEDIGDPLGDHHGRNV